MNIFTSICTSLEQHQNAQRAAFTKKFLRCFAGGYGGSDDQFLGLTVPLQRKIAKQYYKHFLCSPMDATPLDQLIQSKVHEHRFVALEMLKFLYEDLDERMSQTVTDENGNAVPAFSCKRNVIAYYLSNIQYVNNRNLVDTSCYKLLGDWCIHVPKRKETLYEYARSEELRQMRIAMVSTMAFVRQGQLDDTFAIAEILLKYQINKEPKTEYGGREGRELTNKAVGRLVREAGKRDQVRLESFLDQHVSIMPRTMLRYAIEKFEETKRQHYLQK